MLHVFALHVFCNHFVAALLQLCVRLCRGHVVMTGGRCQPGKHKFRGGGISKSNREAGMDRKYTGECCGGDKLPGDIYGKLWRCTACPHMGYVCGLCREELKPSKEQQPTAQTNKAIARAAKPGELERAEPTPCALSKFVHEENQAKRARVSAPAEGISEEAEIEALMDHVEKNLHVPASSPGAGPPTNKASSAT